MHESLSIFYVLVCDPANLYSNYIELTRLCGQNVQVIPADMWEEFLRVRNHSSKSYQKVAFQNWLSCSCYCTCCVLYTFYVYCMQLLFVLYMFQSSYSHACCGRIPYWNLTIDCYNRQIELYVIVGQSCMVCTSTTCMTCWSACNTVCYMHVVSRKTHQIHHLHVCKGKCWGVCIDCRYIHRVMEKFILCLCAVLS